jgi:hypothetical protein
MSTLTWMGEDERRRANHLIDGGFAHLGRPCDA